MKKWITAVKNSPYYVFREEIYDNMPYPYWIMLWFVAFFILTIVQLFMGNFTLALCSVSILMSIAITVRSKADACLSLLYNKAAHIKFLAESITTLVMPFEEAKLYYSIGKPQHTALSWFFDPTAEIVHPILDLTILYRNYPRWDRVAAPILNSEVVSENFFDHALQDNGLY